MKKLLFFAMILVVGLTACQLKKHSIILKKSTDSIIVIDYTKRISEMIVAGNYGWFDNQLINDINFPLPVGKIREETLIVKLFHFGCTVSEAEVRALLGKNYRPAELPELLAFGAQYPDAQIQHPIAAIGSSWQGYGGVPYIGYDSDKRVLTLNWNHYEWSSDFYFLAVKTESLGYSN